MVGVNIFANIHDIMGLGSANSVFGGVSVLAVGYLLQLPPVGALPVFSSRNDKQVNCYSSLWKRHVKLIEFERNPSTKRGSAVWFSTRQG